MKIDYSYNPKWKYAAHIPTMYVYGTKHFVAAFHKGFGHGIGSRLGHLIMGIMEFTPLLNAVVAPIDKAINDRIKMVRLDNEDPYERGKAFGKGLRKETQQMYKSVQKMITKDEEFLGWREIFENNIPEHVKNEMRGLAKGAKVSYEDVLDVHTFVDINAGKFGCSVVGTNTHEGQMQTAVCANHSVKNKRAKYVDADSVKRRKALKAAPLDKSNKGYRKALRDAKQNTTIQSIIFDPSKNRIQLAAAWGKAPTRNWKKIKNVFSNSPTDQNEDEPRVKLARNLDWPWPICGSELIVVCIDPGEGRNRFVSVTWPGYLGILSGMNDQGMALAAAQCGSAKQVGTPVPMIFRTLLEEASTTEEALGILDDEVPASSMNLVIAGKDGVASVEIDPDRAEKGAALVEFTES